MSAEALTGTVPAPSGVVFFWLYNSLVPEL